MTEANLTARAFEIADESMFSLLQCHCLACDEHGVTLVMVGDDDQEVRTLDEAQEAIRAAVDWLSARGYVELSNDDGGHVVVLRRPDGLGEVAR